MRAGERGRMERVGVRKERKGGGEEGWDVGEIEEERERGMVGETEEEKEGEEEDVNERRREKERRRRERAVEGQREKRRRERGMVGEGEEEGYGEAGRALGKSSKKTNPVYTCV